MKIKTIGFGCTKNLGNYQNLRVYMEAELEDEDEDVDVALDMLRTRVAEEIDLGDEYRNLRMEIADKKIELANLISSIERLKSELEVATNKWTRLVEYFSASDSTDIGSFITGVAITPQINFDEIDNDDDDCDDDDNNDGDPIAFAFGSEF